MFIPLTTFSPETDSANPGTITSMSGYVPTVKGYAGAPSQVESTIDLGAECRGAATVQDLDGSYKSFLGTQTKLYKATGTTLEDVSIAGNYTGSSSSKWRFAQQGTISFACNKVDETQFYTGTGDFANLTGAPKASIVETVGNFVFLFDINDGTDKPNGYATCAEADYTDWTPDIDTGAITGTIYDTPGPITAGKKLSDYIIVYKAKSMYLARYVGSPKWHEFSLVSDIVGAVSNEAVAVVGASHFFMGDDNFWRFDSTVPVPIGDDIREWFNGQINHELKGISFSIVDLSKGVVTWYYPTTNSSVCDAWVAYNYRTNKWGHGVQTAKAGLNYVSSGRTYDDVEALFATYDDLEGLTYSAIEQPSNTPIPAIVTTGNKIAYLNGAAVSQSMKLWDFGMDGQISFVSRIRPRYVRAPDNAALQHYYRDNFGENHSSGVNVTETSGKFDLMWSSRWHAFDHFTYGDCEISGFDVDIAGDSLE